MRPRELLLIPGPTPVPDPVLAALAKQPIGHRSAELSQCLRLVADDLKWLGDTRNDVFVFTSSGTGGMEAAIANTINAGDRVLCLVCGVFGERWAKIAEVYGAQVERLKVDPGKAIEVETLKQKLAEDKSIKAVTITHNETSTGVINDLQKICQAVREHGALSIVDAVTSFAAAPLPIDSWGADIVVTGSQKALMLPPGLAIVFVSDKAFEANASCKNPRFYFDFAKAKKSMDADTTPFTPNVPFLLALQASLNLIREEGKDALYARHQRLKSLLRAGLASLGLTFLAEEAFASPSVTSIYPPEGLSVEALRKELKERFKIAVADGQESLKGKIFRISHMGYVFERDMLTVLAAISSILKK